MRTPLLFVDDRPCSLTRPCSLAEALFDRPDVQPVLLRFEAVVPEMPEPYLKRTAGFPAFVVSATRPLSQEVRRFQTWCTTNGLMLERVCCMSEPRQVIAQRFARWAGLPSLTEEQARWLRDKRAMKRKVRSLGFTTASWAPVCRPEDVVRFGTEQGWPVVVKPVDGFGCIDTHLLRDPADAEDVALHRRWAWIAEGFVPDREYECCALIFDGEVLDVFPSAFPAPPLAAADGDINANISMGAPGDRWPADFREIVARIVEGMSLDHGYLHMELFIGEGGRVTISEIALRMAGCEIAKNHALAYGFDMFRATLDTYLGLRPELVYTRRRCVGDLLLPIRPGRVVGVTPTETLLPLEGVIGGYVAVSAGQVIECIERASHSCAGYIHVEGASVLEVERRMRHVLSVFRLDLEPLG